MSHIIYQITSQVNARNDLAVDSGGYDCCRRRQAVRSTKTKSPDRSNWCTFVVKGGKVDRQQVSIGQRSDLAAEIRQGVKQGDVMILYPSEQIKIGDRVNPR
jgi:hypothetical protein